MRIFLKFSPLNFFLCLTLKNENNNKDEIIHIKILHYLSYSKTTIYTQHVRLSLAGKEGFGD